MFDNQLNQDFSATAPNQKWVGDITYLWTEQGWLYLAVILDLYSRQVIGWSMSERMTADLVCDALQMAIFKRKCPKGVKRAFRPGKPILFLCLPAVAGKAPTGGQHECQRQLL